LQGGSRSQNWPQQKSKDQHFLHFYSVVPVAAIESSLEMFIVVMSSRLMDMLQVPHCKITSNQVFIQ